VVATPHHAPEGSGIASPHSSTDVLAWPGPSPARSVRGRHVLVGMVAAAGLVGPQGCAAIGLTLPGVGGGIMGGTGVTYTLDSVASKAFATPVETVEEATLRTPERTNLEVLEDQSTESGRRIVAVAGDRTIEIERERVTAQLTCMRVVGKRGRFFKDRATATETLARTGRTWEEAPARSAGTYGWQRRTPPSRPARPRPPPPSPLDQFAGMKLSGRE